MWICFLICIKKNLSKKFILFHDYFNYLNFQLYIFYFKDQEIKLRLSSLQFLKRRIDHYSSNIPRLKSIKANIQNQQNLVDYLTNVNVFILI